MSHVASSTSIMINGPCGACKFLRRKCIDECIFAPYFDSDQGATFFAAVHKIFGASNVSKLLMSIPVYKRPDAVATICYEAQARIRDPIHGCVSLISSLENQVASLHTHVAYLQAHIDRLENSPRQHPAQQLDIPQAATLPATYDLSVLFGPNMVPNSQAAWAANQQQQQIAQRQHQLHDRTTFAGAPVGGGVGGGDNVQALAREILQRNGGRRVGQNNMMMMPPHSN